MRCLLATVMYATATATTLQMKTNREAVIVCFCHLGVTCVALSHLLNTTPVQLWQGLFLAPTSVTIVGTEERKPGEVYFRCQTVGDVHHLLSAGEPVSYYGAFNDPFQFNIRRQEVPRF